MKALISALLFITVFSLLSCNSDSPFETDTDQSRVFVHVLNVYPHVPSVDIRFVSLGDTQIVARSLPFNKSWPESGYASLLIDLSRDTLLDALSNTFIEVWDHEEQILLRSPFNLKNSFSEQYRTLILADSFQSPLLVSTVDFPGRLPDSVANARLVNVDPNYTEFSASLALANSDFRIPYRAFLNYSAFRPLPVGQRTIYFVNDRTDVAIDSITDLNVEADKVYYFYMAHDGAKPVVGYKLLAN